MSSSGMFSIGGIASGLDTTGIINQLMALERQPVTRLQSTQAQLRGVDNAWSQVNTKLSSLRTAVDAISRPDRFSSLVTVSSSNTDAVGVARAATSATGSVSFSVEQLARPQQVTSGVFRSATDPLAATGRLDVQVGTKDPVSIDVVAGDSLQTIANKLNRANAGVTASVVKTGDDEHRLLISSKDSGAANTVQVSSTTGLAQLAPATADQPDGMRVLQSAQDAVLRLGTGDDAIVVRRSSNTVTDLVPGATLTLRKATNGDPVTVTSQRDPEAAVTAVKTYVEALNGAIKTLNDLTRYDATAKTAGALQGDPAARRLLDQLRTAVSAPPGATDGPFSSAAQLGITVDRTGTVTLDDAKLRTALQEDFDAVGRLFGRTATPDDARATGVIGGVATQAGTYQVRILQPASATRATAPGGFEEAKTFRIQSAGRTATVTLDPATMGASEIVDALNAALRTAQIATLSARRDGDSLVIEESRMGPASTFTIQELGADGRSLGSGGFAFAPGQSVVGEIAVAGNDPVWLPMTGAGRQLTASTGPGAGISLSWNGTEKSDEPVAIAFRPGLAGNVHTVLRAAEGVDGLVARARKGIADQINVFQTRIDGFQQRLETRESTLRRQFVAMESALAQMNAQGNWLAGQLSGLRNLNQF
ncbi:flagellar filament capping protein FliD [Egicoccus halophilus]|uniref:Flagellar hook-associated protein 2 n=1 Tax=Egicoccus halophilus TaxID=1670830 RepID=A0A8J3AAU1_9ACTN|nr:flagellar filament capping protein FliD [Egicoccus halophilus]GGI06677.1 hypothetical protein GCM10011354_20290 [Egicoccus halophilus]